MKKLFLTFVSPVFVMLIAPLASVLAQSTPVNYIGLNFNPITTSTSYNYNWSTGALTLGTATASVYSTQNVLENNASDPTPPDPNGYGTFIGTARPVKSPTGGGAVLYEQSVCGSGYPTCFSDGTFTYGDMVMYTLRGATLDQLTTLQTDYYVEHGCFGGGSPRFQIRVSNASGTKNIFVYLGTPPNFMDCPAPDRSPPGISPQTPQDCDGIRLSFAPAPSTTPIPVLLPVPTVLATQSMRSSS